MKELAVPMFIVGFFTMPIVVGLAMLLLRMIEVRHPWLYQEMGRPSFLLHPNLALYHLGHFVLSRQPGQLGDPTLHALVIVMRVLTPLWVATTLPFLYRLFAE